MSYLERFRGMVAELEADPRIVVQRAFLGEPAKNEALAQAQRSVGTDLAPEILGFYRELNGASIRWVLAEHATAADRKRKSGPFREIDSSNSTPGLIHFMPIEDVFVSADRYQDELWFDWMEDSGEKVKIGKKRYEQLAFAQGLRPFDYYCDFSMAGFFVGGKDSSPPVLLGDDHGADWSMSGVGDFAAYVDGVLALRGSVPGRRTFMLSSLSEALGWPFAVAEWRKAPPSLDQVIAWSRPVGDDDDADERWVADVEPLLKGSKDPKAKRFLREIAE